MKIQYLGHSAFRLISDLGMTILCDPYDADIVGYSMPKVQCDLVTESHHHPDHDYEAGVKGDPSIVDCKCAFLADDVSVESFECFHDPYGGTKRGDNLAFKFDFAGGLSVVHLGDVGERNQRLIEDLGKVSVLLVPVGGYYTIGAEDAKWYVDNLHPSVVVPMHYAQGGRIKIDDARAFLRLFDGNVIKKTGDTLSFDEAPEGFCVAVMERFCE